MYRIANAKKEQIDSDGKWVIICLLDSVTHSGDYSHGGISYGFPTKKQAIEYVRANGIDWCEGCQHE